LPDVLSIDEVRRLIQAVRTPHNRAFLWTVYSLGLRVQEALNLQVGDIDSARMVVHVHRGKGAKDRFVPLPPRTLTVLRDYWRTHRHPEWLFPALGHDHELAGSATRPMAASSVNAALRQLVLELGIKKRVSVHTLRHTYATHLLEAGINLRLIQQYLGHSSLKATMIYLHLTSLGQEQARATIEKLMSE
jgi:site-specific recombinase XerD